MSGKFGRILTDNKEYEVSKVENSDSATIEEHFNVISSLDIETATYRSETLLNYLMWHAP